MLLENDVLSLWDMVHILLKYHCVNWCGQFIFISILFGPKVTSIIFCNFKWKRKCPQAILGRIWGPEQILPQPHVHTDDDMRARIHVCDTQAQGPPHSLTQTRGVKG